MTTITDAHRAEEQGMTTDTDASVNYLRTALAETDRIASDLQTLCDKQATELDRLRADLSEERHAHNKTQFDLAEARKALGLYTCHPCPVCNGDCSSANPPVYACPTQAAMKVFAGEHRSKSDA